MALYQRILTVLLSVAAVIFLCGVPDTLIRYLDEETVISIYIFGFFAMLLSTSTLLLVYSVSQMFVIGIEHCRRKVKSDTSEQNSDR